ncbi:Glucose-induced degradation protein 8-like [Pseudocercospora fuligena]|uniref:Glucose-induced degradation protein 8-like n=1 Tax=Pseudocercospora fuligena TaxID=685502 RepID=A0A8H6RKL2_9PEZI|nr:Glucose-induced degradation protein 8-like [Pseudocercospora fuligena]
MSSPPSATSTMRPVHSFDRKVEDAKPSKSDINWVIMDYLVSEGYPGAAEKFAQETNICSPADMDSIRERVRIRNAIHAGRIEEAVEMINELDSEILDDNHHLHFDLLQLQIIEMIRAIINKPGSFQVSEFKPVLEAATHQLAPRAPTDQKYQQAVDRTMSLMVFPVEKMPPEIKELLDLKLRERVANNVNKYILEKRGERSQAKIFNLVRARAWAEAQARDAKVDLPQNIPIGLDGDATAQVAGDVMVQ